MIISESWLHSGIPDAAMELTGRILHCHDRNQDSQKQRGGGLCIYISEKWATNTKTIDSHCSPDLEYLTVKCRPFFLHREFSSAVLITAVYIAPDAKAKSALSLLYSAINTKMNKYPEAVHIIAGDLNHVDLKAVFPKFHQHVTCATRGESILDKVYSNIKRGYRAIPTPHLGQSDHISLFMLPAYIPLRKREPPTSKTVKI